MTKSKPRKRFSRRGRLIAAFTVLKMKFDEDVLFDVCRLHRNSKSSLLELFQDYISRV